MFQRIVSLLLCTCLIAGSVPETAYAASLSAETQTESTFAETEEVSEVDEGAPEGEGAEDGTVTDEPATEETDSTGETATEEAESSEESASEETESTEEPTTEEAEPTDESTTEEAEPTETEEEETEAATEETETATENTKESETEEQTEEQPENVQADTEDTDIILTLNETQSVTLEYGNSKEKWFAFTAPETGCYSFKSKLDKSTAYIYLYKNHKDYYDVRKYIYTDEPVNMLYEMEAGEVIYVKASTTSDAEPTYTITVTSVPKAEMTVGEDGSYKAVCGDYIMDIRIEPGYTTAEVNVALTAKEGKKLDSQYYIGYEHVRANVSNSNTFGRFSLSDSDGYAVSKSLRNFNLNEEYELRLNLQDADGNTIVSVCNESNPICFSTKYTEEAAFLTVDSVNYKSAKIRYEKIDDVNMYGYYEPINGTGEKEDFTIFTGVQTETLYGMNPATEYRVWIENADGDIVAEQKLTTDDLSMKTDYQITSTAGTITINAEVSEYDGDMDELYLCVKYPDADGEERTSQVNIGLTLNGEKKKGSNSCTISELIENTAYPITMWVQEGRYISSSYTHYAEETREVSTSQSSINPDDVTFTVAQETDTPSTIKCTVTIPEQTKNVSVRIRCREKGKTTWSYSTLFWVLAGKTTNSTSYTKLQEGVEYELQLEVPDYGIRKNTTYQYGEPLYVPVVSDDTDTFDSVLSYQLVSEKVSLADSSWYVTASYRKAGDSSFTAFEKKSELTADDYKLELKTGDYCLLIPDTDYTIKWELYKDEEEEECHTLYQEIHTKNGGITVTAEKPGVSSYSSTINISARLDNLKKRSLILCAYVREPGGEYRRTGSNMYSLMYFLGETGDTSETLSLDGLKPDTTYEVSLRDFYGRYEEYTTLSFTTPKDDRVLEFNSVKPYMQSAKLTCTLSGDAVANSNNCILVYYREKGCNVWQKEYSRTYREGSDTIKLSSYGDEPLKKETVYEYVIGLGKSYYTPRSFLTQTVSGEFTTLPDNRELSVEVTTYLHSADVAFQLSGEAAEEYYNYMLFYYREKGSEAEYEKIYSCQTSTGTSKGSIYRFAGEWLKEETAYEYVAGFGEDKSTPKEELIKTVTGEFTTKKDERTLQNAQIQSSYGTAEAKVEFVNNPYAISTKIYFFYREKGTETWKSKVSDSFSGKTKELSFKVGDKEGMLTAGTDYEYVFVIGNYGETISSPDDVTDEGKKLTGEFTTKKSAYTLEIAYDEANSTYNKAVLNVAAKNCRDDLTLYVVLTLDNGMRKEIILSRMRDYQNPASFKNLTPNTTYKVTKAVLYVQEKSCDVVIDTLTPDISFTTKEAKAPTQISLSKTELALNAAGTGEGVKWDTLTVDILPEDAAEEVSWSSSDEKVVVVSAAGKVTAVGDGTAVVTVKSDFDETITASCNVTVKNYVVAENVDGVITEVTSKQLYKGDSLSSLGLYEKAADGTLTLLEDFNVTPARSGVVQWKDGTLTGTAPGTTNVTFEKNGIQALLTVKVSTKAKGFGIVGLTTSNSEYPAILSGDGSYELACVDGITYTAKGEISPAAAFDATEFDWISSDETVATVVDGVIEPKKAGQTVITVTPKGETSPYVQDKAEVKLDIRELPVAGDSGIYTLTNQKKNMVLADVAFPEGWEEGWQWKNPQTKLYSLPVNKEAYPFEAVYTGTEKYEDERTVNVYIGTVTGIAVSEVDDDHNKVIQVSGNGEEKQDQMRLVVEPVYTGALYPGLKTYMEAPAKSGISIVSDEETGSFVLTASKKGNSTLKTEIKMSTGKKDASGNDIMQTIVKGTYKVKAVTAAQAYSISLSTDTEGVKIDEENGRITFDWTEETAEQLKGKEINLTAVVKDRNGNEIDTALEWKSADSSVAAVKYAKKSSHQATVTIKGDGHAVLKVKAKDDTGYTVWMALEIRNHRPRVDKEKLTINLAYDYTGGTGRALAEEAGGAIEIAEVYEEDLSSIALYKEDGETLEEDFALYLYSMGAGWEKYLLHPIKEDLSEGTYKCQLAIKTAASEKAFIYPLEIKVENKAPKVTVKMSEKINLFYLTKNGSVIYNISGNHSGIEEVIWEDCSAAENNGFKFGDVYRRASDKAYTSQISHEAVELTGRNLADPDVAVGTLKVKLYGVREPIDVTNFKIGYSYKKPSLKTVSSTTSVSPDTGNRTSKFRIYDNLLKKELSYSATNTDCYYYNEISCSSENVSLRTSGSYVYDTYNGSAKKETFTVKIDSLNWRESLEVKHTIKTVKPKVVLTNSALTYNKAYKSEQSTYVRYQYNTYLATLCDLEIKGSNAKAQALVDKDIFEIIQSESSSSLVEVKLNQVNLMEEDVKAGTYTFKLTPYYISKETGEKTALNTLNLKLKVLDKAVTVKISPKGTLDLAKSTVSKNAENSIAMKAKFANLGDGSQIISAKLKGEYNKYFKLVRTTWVISGTSNVSSYTYDPGNYYYIKIANYGKLKANHTYRLSVEYTIRTSSGDEFKVESNVFKVKPKQTAPKVTVENNSQTMYAASSLFRSYTVNVPEGYSIESAYGYLDCNKDGKNDIVAYKNNSIGTSVTVYVTIVDADAITASTKGKSYSIPITVTVKGRDGISKDAKATIKVKVKR